MTLPLFLLLAACPKPNAPTAAAEREDHADVAAVAQAPTPEAALARNFERVAFEYDSARLTSGSKAALTDNARILQEHPKLRVEVQGHCDERGTTEYNLALGDLRAAAVRDYLAAAGAGGSQVTTVSYGEERPLDPRTAEVAWAQNRRAEFRVLSDAGEGVVGTVP